MHKTEEEVTSIIIEELTKQMIRDGKQLNIAENIINQAVSSAAVSISTTAKNISNKIFS